MNLDNLFKLVTNTLWAFSDHVTSFGDFKSNNKFLACADNFPISISLLAFFQHSSVPYIILKNFQILAIILVM